MRIGGVMLVVGAFVLILIAFIWKEIGASAFVFGVDQIPESDVFLKIPILVSVATVIGVWSKAAFDVATKTNPEPTFKQVISDSFSARRLFAPLLVSPIVIGAFYNDLKMQTDLFLMFIVAYQNGFFWKTILSRK